LEHQVANSKQFKESGKPACKKQDATWTVQALAAVMQPFASLKSGMGVEHQSPHLYSQVGVGVTVVVLVQRDGLVGVLVMVIMLVVVKRQEVDDVLLVVFKVEELEELELELELELEELDKTDELDELDELEELEELVVVLALVLELVLELMVLVLELEVELELELGGFPPVQGSVDSISFAT
jgi:hypothetical protein